MKVIRMGEPGTYTGEHICEGGFFGGYKGCRAVLEVDSKDLFIFTIEGQREADIHCVCFKCCECSAVSCIQTDGKSSDKVIPDRVVRTLQTRKDLK